MAKVELVLTFQEKLDCGKCDKVLFWLHDPMLIASNEGVTDLPTLTHFIIASIKEIACIEEGGFQYTFEYDDQLLVNPDVLLRECDIRRVCCAGCTIQYVDETLGRVGFPDLAPLSGCSNIGFGFMLREFSYDGTLLTVTSAPEHDSQSSLGGINGEGHNHGILPLAGPGTYDTPPIQGSIVNSSSCRSLFVNTSFRAYHDFLIDVAAPGLLDFTVSGRISGDGINYFNWGSQNVILSNYGGTFRTTPMLGMSFPTVSPSATYTWFMIFRVVINVQTAPATITSLDGASNIQLLGNTTAA